MDWSKSKTILIIALAITNLIIGAIYGVRVYSDVRAQQLTAEQTRVYLEQQGMEIECEIPTSRAKLPVLFAQLTEKENSPSFANIPANTGIVIGNENEAPAAYYRKYPIFVIGDEADLASVKPGTARGRITSASNAVLNLLEVMKETGSLKVYSIELVYYIDRISFTQDKEDTALPAWRISTSEGIFYCEALH